MARRSHAKELLEFEIAFYERLLEEKPNFADALMALGEAYTRGGFYEKGFAVDQRLTQLKAHDPVVWYNLACSLSLLKRFDEALTSLRRALELGYDDFEYLGTDPDLQALRQSPQFRRFVETLVSSKSP